MGKLTALQSHTVNSPVRVVKHIVIKMEARLCCTAWWQGYFNNPPFKQKLKTHLSEPSRNHSLTCSPMFRYRKPMEPLSPSSSCFSVPPISTMHSDSGCAGSACILRGCKQSWGKQDRRTTPVSQAWHGKTGFNLHLRILKMPFQIFQKKVFT